MNRVIRILAGAILFLVLVGLLLHRPLTAVDTVSGATQRSSSVWSETGRYLLGVNPDIGEDGLPVILKEVLCGRAELDTAIPAGIQMSLTVSRDDPAMVQTARALSELLKAYDVTIEVREYSDVMARSRICSGRYDLYLLREETVAADELEQDSFLVLDRSEMG